MKMTTEGEREKKNITSEWTQDDEAIIYGGGAESTLILVTSGNTMWEIFGGKLPIELALFRSGKFEGVLKAIWDD